MLHALCSMQIRGYPMKLVRDLMVKNVITVTAESFVSAAAKHMKDHKIGAVVVVEENKLIGIFTERDLVNQLFTGTESGNGGTTRIKAVMSKDLLTASPNQSCDDLMESMKTRGIRHVPVVEEELLVGILSMRDLVWYHVKELERVAENLRKTTVSKEYLDKANQLLIEKTLQLENLNEKLKNSSMLLLQTEKFRALGEMTAGLAHELNQPLHATQIICQSILRDMEKDRYDTGYLGQDIPDIKRQIDRMADIIGHMMVFTEQSERIEKNVDINLVLENAFKFTEQQLQDLNIELVKELSPQLPLFSGNPIRLEQAFLNIINNAREAVKKSHKEKKTIKIKTYSNSQRESVEVKIIDNGIGIPEDEKGKIFQPFFTTADSALSTGKPSKGVGLGLSTARHIIEDHQGRINVASTVGEGATFTVILSATGTVDAEKGNT